MSDVATPIDPDAYYYTALEANIGVVSREEQETLRRSKVAIAGLGGAGGINAMALVRTGIGKFHLADFDTFSVSNVHRQFGASATTIGKPKVEVVAGMLEDIHPSTDVRRFPAGVTADTLDAFLDGVQMVVDSIDIFALDAHVALHDAARQRGIPVVIATPVGFGATVRAFGPGSISFSEYFDFNREQTGFQQLIRFVAGLAPHWPKYVDHSRGAGQAGATGIYPGVALCGSLVATEVVRFLLGRGGVTWAPQYMALDPYLKTSLVQTLRWGNRGPLQRLKIRAIERRYEQHATLFNDRIASMRC